MADEKNKDPKISDQALKSLDDFKSKMDDVNTSIVDMGNELGDSLVKKLTQVVVEAKKIKNPLKEIESISKQVNDLADETAVLYNQEAIYAKNYVKALQDGNKEEQSKLLKKLDQIRSHIDINQQLLTEFQTLKEVADIEQAILDKEKAITEEKKKQTSLSDVLKKKFTDQLSTLKNMFTLGSIVDMLFKGSENIANFRKELGMSYSQAYALNTELGFIGNNVNDAYINGEKLKKSFNELSKEMGFVADYGAESLVTMTNLTGRLGLAGNEAAQLTTLSRFQSKDTEKVLSNVGKTVSAMNKQKGTSILLKDVMKEIGNVSKATAISLGSNPVAIAKAVTAAKQLGTTMSQLEQTSDHLLNFESSIESELKAELLTGKQLNLERARAAALSNDMVTLSEEIGKNQDVINSFAKGNRLEQQAIAESLGMSREELAKMIYQQEAQKIGADGVRAKYGEQAYEQLKAQNAQEKFNNAIEKLQSALSSVVQIFSPIIDAVAFLAEGVSVILSKWYLLYPIVGIVALSYLPKMIAGFKNIGTSIADSAKNFTKLFSKEGRASLFSGAGAKKPEVPTPEAGKTGKGAGGLMDSLKGIKTTDMIKGAAAILILSAALFVAAKAFQEFANVEFEDVMLGIGAIGALAGIAFLLSKAEKDMIKGAVAVLILGAALIPFSYAMSLIAGLDIEAVLAAGAGLLIFGAAVFGLGALMFTGVGAMLFGAGILALIALGGAMIVLGAGLKVVSEGGKGIAQLFNDLSQLDATKLDAIAPALKTIGEAVLYLGAGGVLSAVGNLLGGDSPVKMIQDIAASGDGLQAAATGLQGVAVALTQVSSALAAIDASKLEALSNFSVKMSIGSAVKGITDFITAPIKAIEGAIGGGGAPDNAPMVAAINEVRDAVNKLYAKEGVIYLDSAKIGTAQMKGTYKTA